MEEGNSSDVKFSVLKENKQTNVPLDLGTEICFPILFLSKPVAGQDSCTYDQLCCRYLLKKMQK